MNIKGQKKLFDIEWFEGPLLSLFSNSEGGLFIYKWVDVNSDRHTWLVSKTNHELVAAYAQKVISEQALILLSPEKSWYLVDINPNLQHSNQRALTIQDMKQTVLPSSHTYFNEDNCTELDKLHAFIEKDLVAA